jgi:hypothetical protein
MQNIEKNIGNYILTLKYTIDNFFSENIIYFQKTHRTKIDYRHLFMFLCNKLIRDASYNVINVDYTIKN